MKTRKQIADELGISSQTLYRWTKEINFELNSRLISVDKEIELYEALGMTYRSQQLKKRHQYE